MEHLRHLLPFIARYRKHLLLGVLCAAGTAGLTAAIPLIVRQVVDDLNTRGVVASELLRYGGIMLLIALVDSGFRFGQRMFVNGCSYLIEFDIRSAVFDRLLSLEQGFYGQMHTGDLMARVTNDLSAVRQILGPGFNSCITAALFITATATLMLMTNTTLALVVLLLLPIITIVFTIVGGRMRQIFRHVQDQFGDISTRAQENFSGIRTIKAYAQEQAEIRVFHEANEQYRRLNVRPHMAGELTRASHELRDAGAVPDQRHTGEPEFLGRYVVRCLPGQRQAFVAQIGHPARDPSIDPEQMLARSRRD